MKGEVRGSNSARLGEVRDGSRRMPPPKFLPTGREEEPISNPDLTRPDARSIHAAARQAEFAEAARSMLGANGCPPTDGDLPVSARGGASSAAASAQC